MSMAAGSFVDEGLSQALNIAALIPHPLSTTAIDPGWTDGKPDAATDQSHERPRSAGAAARRDRL
jgi:hypothetical protein